MSDVIISRNISFLHKETDTTIRKEWVSKSNPPHEGEEAEERFHRYAVVRYSDTVFDRYLEALNRPEGVTINVEPQSYSREDGVMYYNYAVILSFVFNISQDNEAQKKAVLAIKASIEEYLNDQGITFNNF